MDHILKCHEIAKTDFVRGDGCHLFDRAGKRYLDLESGIWCTALGHCHPRINTVIREQIDKVMHLGTRYSSPLTEETAKSVLDIVGIEGGKCVFLSSGSEAVEFAVQIARRVTGRQRLLAFSSSYLAAYGSAGRKDAEEWCLHDWSSSGSDTDWQEIPFDKLGGFVFEPGGSGIGHLRFPPKQVVQDAARRIKSTSGVLVVNEITTGMGRTGKWFGFQHYEVQPDIAALGKGLGNGYPVSAVAMRPQIAEKLERDGFRYVQSHQNDPLGCAVAKEVIAIMREGDWIEKGNKIGAFFLAGLTRLVAWHPILKEARGRGMLLGLELHPHERITVEMIFRALLEAGFLVGYYPVANLLRFDPPLTLQEDDITSFLDCLDGILGEAD